MHYRSRRLRALRTSIVALGAALFVAACGGSGSGSGITDVNSGADDTQAAQKTETWQDAYVPVRDIDQSRKIRYVGGDAGILLMDNQVVTVGNIEYQNGYVDTLITRYTREGQRLRHDIFKGKGKRLYYCGGACAGQSLQIEQVDYSFNHAKDVARTSNGGFVIVGTSNDADTAIPSNSNLSFAIKYGPNGEKIWQKLWKRCSTLVPCSSQAFAVAVGDNGTVFVSGHGWNTLGTQKFQLQALSATGEFLWHDTRGFSQLDHGYDLLTRAEKGSQYLYVTEPKNNYVHKYQVAGGAHLWDQQFSQRIVHIANAPDGKNLLLFSADGAHVYKIDPKGNVIWHTHNADATKFQAVDVANGHIYVAADRADPDLIGDRTIIYDIVDKGDKADIIWETIYASSMLLNLNIELGPFNFDLSRAYDSPIGIDRTGDTVSVVINTSQKQELLLPDSNMATFLTLDAQTGAKLDSKHVQNVVLYSTAFGQKQGDILYASGQSKNPQEIAAQTKQVTGRFNVNQCTGGLLSVLICTLGF